MNNNSILIFEPDSSIMESIKVCVEKYASSVIGISDKANFLKSIYDRTPSHVIFHLDSYCDTILLKMREISSNYSKVNFMIVTNNVEILALVKDMPVLVMPFSCGTIQKLLH